VVPRDQPNSFSSGSSSAPVEDRKPAAATSAAIVAAATHQARTLVRTDCSTVPVTR
jgi:hypothetical protein